MSSPSEQAKARRPRVVTVAKFCICVIDPDDGEEMFVRHGIVPGEGPVATWPTRKEALNHVSFMKMGMEQGEDYESISVLTYRKEYEE